MSLTSYRAAPPRGMGGERTEDRDQRSEKRFLVSGMGMRLRVWVSAFCSEDLAVTYSPTS
jgi:hypothetical protein